MYLATLKYILYIVQCGFTIILNRLPWSDNNNRLFPLRVRLFCQLDGKRSLSIASFHIEKLTFGAWLSKEKEKELMIN